MSRPGGPARQAGAADAARRRTIIGSIVVGVLIVIAAAAGATAYVGKNRASSVTVAAAPSASTGSTGTPGRPSAPGAPAAAPSIPGTDALGFVGTAARCADGDNAVAMELTAASQAVVCERAGALYYAGWRAATASGTRVDGVVPAGAAWVATAPDATVTVDPAGLRFQTAAGDFTEPATGFWKR